MRGGGRLAWCQVWLCLGSLGVALGGSASAAGFLVPRPWGAAQGLNLAMAMAFAQTADGYLWVGTPSGLYRFNGAEFMPFQPRPSGPNRVALHVTALCADRAGGLWIGSLTEGLFYHQQGRFTAFGSEQGLENDRIKAVFEDQEGGLWVATDGGGAFRRVGNRFEAVRFENGEAPTHPTAFAQDEDGNLWMGTHNSGLYRFRDLQLAEVIVTKATVKGMARGRDGGLWVGTSSGLARVRDGRLDPVSLPGPDGTMTRGGFVTSVIVGQEGALWVGTLSGLIRLEGEVWQRFGRGEGLGNGLVTALFSDREGSVWVGAEIGEVYQVTRSRFKVIEPFFGRLQGVNSLWEDSGGRLWVAGSSGLVAFQDGRRVWAPAPEDFASQEVMAVGEDAGGRIWLVIRGGDWGWWQDGVVTPLVPRATHRQQRWVNFFFRGANDVLWAGTQAGLLRVEADGSLAGLAGARLSHPQTLSVCEDREGALWVGTGHGLNRYREGVLEIYIDLEPRSMDVVSALHADAEGAVWIGTDRGLWRYRGGQFFAFEAEQGGPPVVGQIVEDDLGYLWTTQGEVLSRYARAQLNAVADGRAERIEGVLFSRSAGMRASLVGDARRAWKTRDGLLAFAADQGLLLVDPVDPGRIRSAPPVRIERVVLNGEPLPLPSLGADSGPPNPLLLPPGYNRIEIHYAGLAFRTPERIQFRHRLRNLSEVWEEVGANRMAQFRALPPGRYEFEVAAALGSEAWSVSPARLSLWVQAPWWQAGWLKVVLGVALLAGAGGGYAWRVRRLEKVNQARRDFSMRLLEREESERRRLTRELHDGLGQDLLVLKNEVTLLGQQLPPEREDWQGVVRAIAEASQSAIDGARAMAQNLRPADLDRAGLTRSLAAMLDRTAASASLTLDHALENLDGLLTPEAEVVLYRVTQELINNIYKHAEARRAFVQLRRDADAVELAVADDGRGFDPALVRSRLGPGKGLGLDSIYERVAMLDGEVRKESAPGQGTRFLIRIPLRPALRESARTTPRSRTNSRAEPA